jgi:cell division septum initiation protein DivIVA
MATEEEKPKKEFSISRKGYTPDEVETYLTECDVAFRELEEYAARLKHELAEARSEIARLGTLEQDAIDRAMLVVFDAKERILERAREKAQEIEDEARARAGLEPAAEESPPDTDTEDLSELLEAIAREDELLPIPVSSADSLAAAPPATQTPDGSQQNDVLSQMLREADAIRSQLESGMATAFDQIEKMQREAEDRATAMLDEARHETTRLRSAGRDSLSAQHARDSEDQITVPSDDSDDDIPRDLRSRYSKNSAKLPRIGNDTGVSVLASMNQLRNKLREAEEVARQVQEPPAS